MNNLQSSNSTGRVAFFVFSFLELVTYYCGDNNTEMQECNSHTNKKMRKFMKSMNVWIDICYSITQKLLNRFV